MLKKSDKRCLEWIGTRLAVASSVASLRIIARPRETTSSVMMLTFGIMSMAVVVILTSTQTTEALMWCTKRVNKSGLVAFCRPSIAHQMPPKSLLQPMTMLNQSGTKQMVLDVTHTAFKVMVVSQMQWGKLPLTRASPLNKVCADMVKTTTIWRDAMCVCYIKHRSALSANYADRSSVPLSLWSRQNIVHSAIFIIPALQTSSCKTK